MPQSTTASETPSLARPRRLAQTLSALLLAAALAACESAGSEVPLVGDTVADLRGLAEQGDPAAMTALGQRYETGDGVPLDPDQAIDWYRKASAAGDPPGQYLLGRMHLNGGIQPGDARRAAELFMRAAAHGHAGAQAALARLYEKGEGVPQDYRRAAQFYALAAMQREDEGRAESRETPNSVRWFRRAARLRVAEAQFDLARAYEVGHGVGQDLSQAELWYREAAEQGHDRAAGALARLYGSGVVPTPKAVRDEGARPPEPEPQPAAAAPPAAPPAAPASGAAAPFYVVHLASYRKAEGADRGLGELMQRHGDLMEGLELSINRVEIEGKGTFFRVQAGPFASPEAAAALCEKLSVRAAYCRPMPGAG
jgi:cell division protein FtsN